MKISQKGINLIKEFEGLRLEAYQCLAGKWTIGYGHTANVKQGDKITEKQAEDYLRSDLESFENLVNNKSYVPQSLNQNQFDALVSFAFNLGGKNLKELCTANYPPNKKTTDHIAQEITLYNKAGGKRVNGLADRREKEKKLFLGQI